MADKKPDLFIAFRRELRAYRRSYDESKQIIARQRAALVEARRVLEAAPVDGPVIGKPRSSPSRSNDG